MIKHVVCFKIKEEYLDKLTEAKEKMLKMKEEISYIVDIQVGIDFLHSERSYDLILEVILPDATYLDKYQSDPYHCSVVKKLMHEIRLSSVAIDFELENC